MQILKYIQTNFPDTFLDFDANTTPFPLDGDRIVHDGNKWKFQPETARLHSHNNVISQTVYHNTTDFTLTEAAPYVNVLPFLNNTPLLDENGLGNIPATNEFILNNMHVIDVNVTIIYYTPVINPAVDVFVKLTHSPKKLISANYNFDETAAYREDYPEYEYQTPVHYFMTAVSFEYIPLDYYNGFKIMVSAWGEDVTVKKCLVNFSRIG